MSLLIDSIRNIQNMLNGAYKFETEEATKQGLILPLIQGLGYNIFNIEEVTPEAVADVGSKKGEKVDFRIAVNGQVVMIIECKQRNVTLSDKYIEQLYRYYTTSDVALAVLTNGDDYWFFTDYTRKNIMDTEPYSKIRISELDTDYSITNSLEKYCKSNICSLDVKSNVKEQIFIDECEDIADGIVSNNIPEYIIKAIATKLNISFTDSGINKYKMADILSKSIKDRFLKYKEVLDEPFFEDECSKDAKNERKTRKNNKDKKSNIKLNYEYTYNDYSDGDWQFHKLDYCKINDKKYDNVSAFKAYCLIIDYVLDKDPKIIDKLLERDIRFKLKSQYTYKDKTDEFVWGTTSSVNTDLLIYRRLSIGDVVKSITYVLDSANLQHSILKFSFKE